MFNFFRSFFKRPEFRDYEVIYRYGSGHYFSRTEVVATSLYEARRAFDTDPRFDKCRRVSCTLVTRKQDEEYQPKTYLGNLAKSLGVEVKSPKATLMGQLGELYYQAYHCKTEEERLENIRQQEQVKSILRGDA